MPSSMAPNPLTKPAPGVIATRPTIMPLTAPRNVGFFALLRNMSHSTQASSADDRGEVGVDDRGRRVGAGEVRVTAVEAVPAEPDDAGADRDEGQAVRDEPLPVPGQSWADHPCRDEAAGAGGQVDDVTTGVVDGALVRPVAAAPDQHGVDRVDERRPQRDEDDPDLDLDAAEDATEEQQRRDRGEHELEVEQRCRGLAQRQRRAAVGGQRRLADLRMCRAATSPDARRSSRRSS